MLRTSVTPFHTQKEPLPAIQNIQKSILNFCEG